MANWSSNLIITMTSNTTPSPFVASSSSENSTNFSAWKSFNNSVADGWSSISSPSYPQWIQYKFDVAKKVNKIVLELSSNFSSYPNRMLKDFDIIASNTGSFSGEETVLASITNQTGWNVSSPREFIFSNSNSYLYYRIKIYNNNGEPIVTSGDIQMFESYPLNKFLILSNDETYSFEYTKSFKQQYPPDMTSNTAPSPYVVSASNEYNVSTSPAWKAFNSNTTGTDNQSWSTDSGSSFWLKLDLGAGNEKVIQGFHIHAYRFAGTGSPPNKVTLQGSNDNSNFVDLYAYTPEVATWNNKIVYEFDNDKPYRYYRLLMPTPANTKLMIRDFRLYEYDEQQKVINLSSLNESNFVKYGVDKGRKIDFNSLFSQVKVVNEDGSFTVVNESSPVSLKDKLGSAFSVIEYTDNPTQEQSIISAETEPFSVYDHISETPEVLVYTELIDDIKVETTTEPFDVYDEFGNEVEVLYYTDDTNVNQANLVLEANYSPIDELQGDVEVVTWTSEPQESAQRVLEMVAIPKPQFVKLVNPKRLYGSLDEVVAVDISKSYRDEARYLFSDMDGLVWYVWDFELKAFVPVDASTHSAILKNGMKWHDMNLLSTQDWRSWEHEYMNIGTFLKDNPRDTITSIVDSISYKDYLPRNSQEVEKASLYILNTTAKIDLTLDGALLKGVLSDEDLTRVQYRVFVNGASYYPTDGSFTKLGDSPQNIELTLNGDNIKIDELNTVRVEFQDFFGTTDYWQATFIGTYSGLLFKDVYGNYYSKDDGSILQYLDFGMIIAGQVTLEHEITLKNQYGYDVENVLITADSSNFPDGMICEFSESQSPFVPTTSLPLSGILHNNEEKTFYVRLKTQLGVTPVANGDFKISVTADRA